MSDIWDKNKHQVLQRKNTIFKKFIRTRKRKDSVTGQIWLKVHLDSVAKGRDWKCNIEKKLKR